jgi:serine/threonine protein kinase/WD40 repeat protein/tetratricopeptide (TPR) repeat protein
MNNPSPLEVIFFTALEKGSTEERAAYLDQACAGDPDLRGRVEKMLTAQAQAGSFLEQLARSPLATVDEASLRNGPGTVIGPYKLLEQIGEGGFGVVFLAEQTEPVRRKVALKILKPGMDTRQVVARFEAERQALAIMDHPHIAKVLDGGATATGRPYFVMELVKGVPITEFCDQNHLTPQQRLELFISVCQAVQHAHQKGVIHRDLKPSNVLVSRHDTTPTVKVIDFGVAKALGQNLTDKTLFTGIAQMVGTPLYMSPEQAGMSDLDVDTRGDIYSLGVLLYELLTGTTPFTKERFQEAAYDEIRRIIREEEPPKPSTRLSESKDSLPSISALRQMEPAKLTKQVRGELDWIVMKALEKDRNRRYETANGFAIDIQRYLADEAVQACPPSAVYRFRKFARRHKVVFWTTGMVALVLLVGTVISAWQAIRATEAEGLAQTRLQAETEARNATRDQLLLTQQAEAKATNRLYRSLVEQARASRLSRRIGRRFQTLEVLAEAVKMAKQMNLSEKDFLQLRNETVACLAVADLRVDREWAGWRVDDARIDFDDSLEHYACTNRQGICSIRRSLDGTEVQSLTAYPDAGTDPKAVVPLLSPDGNHVAVWSYAVGALKMWKLGRHDPVLLVNKEKAVSTYAFSPCSRLFAFGLSDGAIEVMDLASRQWLRGFKVGLPHALAFHPTRRQLAVGSGGTTIQICDLDSGKLLDKWPQPAGVNGMVWHPQGNILAVGSPDPDGSIRLWDTATRRQVAQLTGHKQAGFLSFAFNHAGDLLASTSWDGTLRLWDPRSGQQLFKTQAVARPLRFSPDDRFLAAGIEGAKLQIWQVAPASCYRTLVRDPALGGADPALGGAHYGRPACFENDRLALEMSGGVGLWDLRSGKPLGFLPVGDTSAVLFEPSGALLTAKPGVLLRWPVTGDLARPRVLKVGPPQELPLLSGSIGLVSSSRDGRVLASAQGWGGLVWHQDLPGPPIQLSPHRDTRHVSVSPDGQWVATGSFWGTKVKIWEARTGKLAKELPVENGSSVQFSPDGRWLATNGDGWRLWAVPSWQQGPLLSVNHYLLGAFSPDGRVLAVEMGHGVVRLVNPHTGGEYIRLEDPNQDRAVGLAFSADGTQLVATNNDSHSIHVWDLRVIRQHLAKIGLDWDMPPYPPAMESKDLPPLQVTVDPGQVGEAAAAIHASRGLTHLNLGEWDKALAEYNKAIELHPKHAGLWNDRGNAYHALRQYDKAIADYSKAIELDPKLASAWSNRGATYHHLHQYNKALRDLNKAIELDPKLALAWNRNRRACAACLAAAGKGKDADKLDDTKRAELRRKALAWLRDDVQAATQSFRHNPASAALLPEKLKHWQSDPDLSSVRDATELAKLPQAEQQAWRKLWSEVDQLLKQASAAFTEINSLKGRLTATDTEQVHEVKMSAGKTYVIDMTSNDFDTYLRLETANKKILAENDDIALDNLNSRIIFAPKEGGLYRIIATAYQQRGVGAYSVTIRIFQPKKD